VGSGDLHEVRGAVELLLNQLNADLPIAIVPDRRSGFSPSACGRIEWAGVPIGFLGLIDRPAVDALSLRHRPAAAELELSALLQRAQHVPQLHPLPRFPAVRRDLSLLVAETMPYEKIIATIRGLNLPDLEDVEYVTTYRGKPLDKGIKSITVTLVFRSPSTTLTSEQVEQSVQRAIQTAKDTLGATLRT
jgi:phenylalanyl-tRNA synthetase beta chain